MLSFSEEICTVCNKQGIGKNKTCIFLQVLCQKRSDPVWGQGPNRQALKAYPDPEKWCISDPNRSTSLIVLDRLRINRRK
jgi:hypothetical protein